MESTKNNPLAYFESLMVNNGLNYLLQKYLDDFIEHSDYNITSVDNIKGIVKYLDYDQDGKYITEFEARFENILEGELFKKYNESKKVIDESVAEMSKLNQDYMNFLILQEKQIQYIINNGEKQINLFPILLKPLNSITNYINQKYLYESDKKIVLNISFLNLEEPSCDYGSDAQIITFILGYLKKNNEKREKIMSDEQYDLMVGYVRSYVDNNTLPEVSSKLESLKISKELLRFTFWVLHKNLYTTKSIRPSFIQLMKDIFSDFDNWDFNTLKRKFGNKEKVAHYAKPFIPEIIKTELKQLN